MRLFSLGDHYRHAYRTIRNELRAERLRLLKSKVVIDLFVAVLGMGVAAGVMIWMGWRVVVGTAAVGDLAALYQIFTQVQSALGAITGRASDVYESVLFLDDLFVFWISNPSSKTKTRARYRRSNRKFALRTSPFAIPAVSAMRSANFLAFYLPGKSSPSWERTAKAKPP